MASDDDTGPDGGRRGGVGVLDRFEKGIERAVNSAFAKAFRSEVQPVEIASALRRECDDKAAIVGRSRTIAPNTFVVELGPADHERLGEWEEALGEELRTVVHDHARQQRYAFVGPVTVSFEMADDLDTGVFRVRSATTRAGDDDARGQGRPPRPAPQAAPPPAPYGSDYGQGGPGQPGYGPEGYAEGYAPGYAAPVPGPQPYGAGRRPLPAAPPQAHQPSWSGQASTAVPSLEVDGRVHRLTGSVTVLGRAGDADIVLDDPGVSRRHAEVHLLDGRARVVDLGSTNGTYVDGERVHTGVLAEGSTITVGRTRLVFHSGEW